MVNQINVADHTTQWLKSFKNYESTQNLVSENELANARTKDDEIAALTNFFKTGADEYDLREEKKQAYKTALENTDFKLGLAGLNDQDIHDAVEHNSLFGAASKRASGVQEEMLNNGAKGHQLIKAHNQLTAQSWELTQSKVQAAISDFGPWLDDALSDPNRVWKMPDGSTFTSEDWTPEEAAWARKVATIDYFRNNGIIDLTAVNKTLLAPYLDNLNKAQNSWTRQQDDKISGRDSDVKRSKTFKDVLTDNDTGKLLETYRFTTDAKGNPLGRKGAMDQFRADLIAAVKLGPKNGGITREKAEELYKHSILKEGYKGAGKPLSEEYPNGFGAEFDQQIAEAEKQWINGERARDKAVAQKKADDILTSIKDYNDISEIPPEEMKEIQSFLTEVGGMENYAATSLTTRLNALSKEKTPNSAIFAKNRLDEMWKHQTMTIENTEDLIRLLPNEDQNKYREEAKKQNSLYGGKLYKEQLGNVETTLKTKVGIQASSTQQLHGTQISVLNHLNEVYNENYRRFRFAGLSESEASAKAHADTFVYFDKNSEEGGLFEKSIQTGGGKKIRQFNNFNKKGSAGFRPIIYGSKTDRQQDIRDIQIKHSLTNNDIADSTGFDTLFNPEEVRGFLNVGKPGVLISDKVKATAAILNISPLELMNRQLIAHREILGLGEGDLVPSVESPLYEKIPKHAQYKVYHIPTLENSAKAINSINKDKLNRDTIPYNIHWDPITPEDQLPYGAAVTEVMNRDQAANVQDIRDTERILAQFTSPDGTFDSMNFMVAMEDTGVDTQELRIALYKYLPRSQQTAATYPLRNPSLISQLS